MLQITLLMEGSPPRVVKALRAELDYSLDECRAARAVGEPVVIDEFEDLDDAADALDALKSRYPYLDFRVVEDWGNDEPLVEDTEEVLPRICDADLLVPAPPSYDDEPPF